jgi:hypothetical protein
VDEHKAATDLVWDYDVVMSDITDLPMHQPLPGAVGSVLANRDAWIEATKYSTNHCWLIITNPEAAAVGMMRDAGAQIITMDTPDDVCQERLRARFTANNTPNSQ